MQTFLPYPEFKQTAYVLDWRRLGKQRTEARQILNAIKARKSGFKNGWSNHVCVRMWEGYEGCLIHYSNVIIQEWIDRGYINNMPILSVKPLAYIIPEWLGDERLHSSHRAALLAKDYDFYKQYNWREEPIIDYYWPVKKIGK